MTEPNTHTLIEDLRAVVAEAEAVLGAEGNGHGAEFRTRAGEAITRARARLEELEADVVARAKRAGEEATKLVKDNPWSAVGVAAVAGLVLGVLLARR